MICYLKKEWMSFARSGKLIILTAVFGLFGIMNPAIAMFTPKLLEMMADTMAETGMVVTAVEVNALTSWQQFFKNIPMGLIIFVLVMSGIFVNEYAKSTLIIVVTKGAPKWKIALSKYLLLFGTWTGCFLIIFGITYGYNAFYWDNSIAENIAPAALFYWLFGVFVITVMQLFSCILDAFSGVLVGTAVAVMAMYLVSMVPKAADYLPTKLCGGYALMTGNGSPEDFTAALVVTLILTAIGFVLSIVCFNRKSL